MRGTQFIDDMHLISTEVQGAHGLPVPKVAIGRTVANWLGRLFFSDSPSEPVAYSLKIGAYAPKKQAERVRVKREAPWSGGRSFMIVVAPADVQLQYECELECPTEGHAQMTMAKAGFYERDRLSEVEAMQTLVKKPAETKQPTRKEVKAQEEAARAIGILCKEENLGQLCFELGQMLIQEHLETIPLPTLFRVASRICGRSLGEKAWVLVADRLVELGIITIQKSEETGLGYAFGGPRFFALGRAVAIGKDIANAIKAKQAFQHRIEVAQRKLRKAEAEAEEAYRIIADISPELARVEESLARLQKLKEGEQVD